MNFIRFVRRSFARSLICHNKSVARSGDYATNNAEFVTKKVKLTLSNGGFLLLLEDSFGSTLTLAGSGRRTIADATE